MMHGSRPDTHSTATNYKPIENNELKGEQSHRSKTQPGDPAVYLRAMLCTGKSRVLQTDGEALYMAGLNLR
jgi:hypothetical protein